MEHAVTNFFLSFLLKFFRIKHLQNQLTDKMYFVCPILGSTDEFPILFEYPCFDRSVRGSLFLTTSGCNTITVVPIPQACKRVTLFITGSVTHFNRHAFFGTFFVQHFFRHWSVLINFVTLFFCPKIGHTNRCLERKIIIEINKSTTFDVQNF